MAAYLVDTNIISEIAKSNANPAVLDWLDANGDDLRLSAVTVKELYYGALRMPEGKRKDAVLSATENLLWLYSEDILPFDGKAALVCARLHRQAVKAGRTPQIEDLMIASICLSNGLILATRNIKDFDYLGIPLVNPFPAGERTAASSTD